MKYKTLISTLLALAIILCSGCDKFDHEHLNNPLIPTQISFFISANTVLRQYCMAGSWPEEININIPRDGISCQNNICVLIPPTFYFKKQTMPQPIHVTMDPQDCKHKADCIIKTAIFQNQKVLSIDYTTFKNAPTLKKTNQQIIRIAVHADDQLLINNEVKNLKKNTRTDLEASALITCAPAFRIELHPYATM